jgi:hypothetical protein
MQAIIKINMDNDAFIDNNVLELIRILECYTRQIKKGGYLCVGDKEILMDKNGNTVGKAEIV